MSDGAGLPGPKRHADLIAASILVALLTITYADVLFGGRVLFVRDLATFHYPMKTALRDIIRSGDFPFWNPSFSGGQPAAANPQYEVFYPGQWPVFAFEFGFGFRLHILLHVYLATLSMYAFLRSIGCGPAIAFAGASALGWGGPLLSLSNLLPSFFSMAWLPLVLLFARRFLRDRQRRDFVIVVLLIAMQTLICDPASLLVTAVLVVGYGVYARRPIAAGAIVTLGLAAGALQLIPAVDYARDTARGRGFPFQEVAYWSLPPARLLELARPHAFGRDPLISNDSSVLRLYRRGEDGPFLQNLYCGLLMLVAGAAAIIAGRRARIALALSIAAFLLAFGDRTPLLRILHDAWIFRGIRFPERFAIFGALALIVAACLALEQSTGIRRLAPLLGVIVLVDLLPLNREFVPRESPAFFDPPAILRELRGDSAAQRIFYEPEWHASSPTARRYASNRTWLHWLRRNALYPRFPAAWHYRTIFERDIDRTNMVWTEELVAAMWKVRERRRDWAEVILPMANAGWRAAFRPFDEEVARHPDPRTTEPVTFVPLTSNPRFYFADQIVSGATPADFIRALNGARTSHLAFIPGQAFVPAAGRVVSVRETPNSAAVDVETAGPALLVISNTWHKGWRASVDRAPAELIRTNLAFQAVRVPAGRHHVALRFRSDSIIAGAALSALTLLALLSLPFHRIVR